MPEQRHVMGYIQSLYKNSIPRENAFGKYPTMILKFPFLLPLTLTMIQLLQSTMPMQIKQLQMLPENILIESGSRSAANFF